MAAYSTDDWQAQLEEVLALQSIYAEQFRLLHLPCEPDQQPGSSGSSSSSNSSSADGSEDLVQQLELLIGSDPPSAAAAVSGLLSLEALVPVELPAGQLQLVIHTHDLLAKQQQQQPLLPQPPLGRTGSTSAEDQQQQQQGRSSSTPVPFGPAVKHLPPVRVQMQLPVNYPSNAASPPAAALHASWLSAEHQQALQQQLAQVWQEQGPGPICFSLLEHIKVSALPALGITDTLVLSQPIQQHQQEEEPPQQVQEPTSEHATDWQQGVQLAVQTQQRGQQQVLQKHLSARAPVFVPKPAEHVTHGNGSTSNDSSSKGSTHSTNRDRRRGGLAAGGRHAVGSGDLQQGQQHTSTPQQQQQQRQGQLQQPHPSQQQQRQQQGRQQQAQHQQKQQGHRGQKARQHQQQWQKVQGARQPPQQHFQGHKQQGQQQQLPPQGTQKQESPEHPEQQQQQQQPEQEPQLAPACSSGGTGSITVEQLAMQLLRYDAAQELDEFNNSSWTCNICFDNVPGSSCTRLPECRHFYCNSCLSGTAAAQLDSGAVENMRCPEPSCRELMPPYVVKQLLGEARFARWEEMVLSRALDRMDDVVYCPRCDTVSVADKDGCTMCPKCMYAFCAECCDSWHPGRACLNLEERVRVLGRRRRGTTPQDRLHDLDLMNQAMNLKYIAEASKSCPSCSMATMKNEGCNKMSCTNCGALWCWKCGQAISGYEHFRDNSLCVLFEQADIDRWHAMLFGNRRAEEVDALHAGVLRGRAAAGARLCRCPVCGQENLREGRNNLLRCWSCTSHFCYACRTWLRGKVGQHFIGTKACKQHGD